MNIVELDWNERYLGFVKIFTGKCGNKYRCVHIHGLVYIHIFQPLFDDRSGNNDMSVAMNTPRSPDFGL